MTQEGTVKIRMKGVTFDGATKLRVTPRYDALFDENGVAEVPRAIAHLLLGPGYPGKYELVVLVKEEPIQELAKAPKVTKPIKKEPPKEEMDETKAFAQSIVE